MTLIKKYLFLHAIIGISNDDRNYHIMSDKRIQSALIAVFYKEGLADIVKILHELNVKIYSTGGTFSFIADLNIPAGKVEDLTSYPSILGGRVKTLHLSLIHI